MKDFAQQKKGIKKNKRVSNIATGKSPVPIKLILALMMFPVVFLLGASLFFNSESEIYTLEKTENDIIFTFEQDLKNENIYLELEKIYEEATCESFLQIEAYGKKIFAEETLDKMKELGFAPFLEEIMTEEKGLLFRVMIGPMQTISDTNNARETLIRANFIPLVRTRCVQT